MVSTALNLYKPFYGKTNFSGHPLNILLFMGVMSRMIPATTLNTSIPQMQDRGAYMSVTASFQQVAGGIAAVFAGMIVTQKSNAAPLQHYDELGYIVSIVMIVCIYFVYRISVLVKDAA